MTAAEMKRAEAESVKGCLHLVMKASRETLKDCLDCCAPGDAIVLMNTAVTLMAGPLGMNSSPGSPPVYCLAADLQAQGMQGALPGSGATLIDGQDLVHLVCRHRHCLSWK